MVTRNGEPQRLIDLKLPLTWLVSTTAMIIASAFVVALNFNKQVDALTVKMDTILASNTELKQQMKERDGKYEQLVLQIYKLQNSVDVMDMRVSNLEKRSK